MSGSNIKRLLKRSLLGLFRQVELRPKRYHGALATLYHEVGMAANDYCVPAEVFASQIDYLSGSEVRWLTATELAQCIPRFDSSNNICVTFDDGDQSAFQATLDLIAAGGKCTHYIIPGRINQAHKRCMTWDQVRELDQTGVEIGSHSMTHPHLARLSDSQLAAEITDSKSQLEDKLGREVGSFAYPYGEHDARVVNQVRAAGYSSAFTTQHFYVSNKVEVFKIPRFEPTESLRHLMDLFEGRAHLFYGLLERYLDYRGSSAKP